MFLCSIIAVVEKKGETNQEFVSLHRGRDCECVCVERGILLKDKLALTTRVSLEELFEFEMSSPSRKQREREREKRWRQKSVVCDDRIVWFDILCSFAFNSPVAGAHYRVRQTLLCNKSTYCRPESKCPFVGRPRNISFFARFYAHVNQQTQKVAF